jgi:disease resistance protein RPM1
MAPEYLYKGEISTMSDIYSLGMIIIEITIREKNCAVSDSQDKAARKFVDNVTQLYLVETSYLGFFYSFN